MAQTEAQLRASKKYRNKYEYLQARVTPEEKLQIIEHTRSTNESLNDFMRRSFRETMTRDKDSGKSTNK